MQHFTEEHTSKNLANLLDKTVRIIPSLDLSKTKLTSVNDNAANIVRGISLSETITGQVYCTAHTLQLVINDCLQSVVEVNEILDKCRALAAKTHRSSKVCNKLKEMCERLDGDPSQTEKWPYRVIISPGGIRWDSMFFCMESILKMEEPLLQLKTLDADFSDVPTEEEFVTMSELAKLLALFHNCTMELSAEITPTMHNVVVLLYNLSMGLMKGSERSKCKFVQAWATHAILSLDQRIPDVGTANKNFALGNFFNPKYQGLIARTKNRALYDQWIEELITESTGGAQVLSQTPRREGSTTEARELDDAELLLEQAGQPLLGDDDEILIEPPLKTEIRLYLGLEKKLRPRDLVVLEWWRVYQDRLPLLAALARQYLCIPATSAPSERLFSTAGNNMTFSR